MNKQFSLPVDPKNPGHFLACIGLLEMANRAFGAEGWFDQQDRRFCVQSNHPDFSLVNLVQMTASMSLEADITLGDNCTMQAGVPLNSPLDWWVTGRGRGNAYKYWGGVSTPLMHLRIGQSLLASAGDVTDLFGYSAAYPANTISGLMALDSRVKTCALDAGFSYNEAKDADKRVKPQVRRAYPAVDLYGLIGMARFLPVSSGADRRHVYWTWTKPLAPELVVAAALGVLPHNSGTAYSFEMFKDGKYKAFRSGQAI